MAVTSDVVGQGTLTGGGVQDTLRTGANTEYHVVTFTNYSANTVTLDLWLNGVADVNRIAPPDIALLTKESIVLRVKIASTDTIRAEASAANAIVWTDEMDVLT